MTWKDILKTMTNLDKSLGELKGHFRISQKNGYFHTSQQSSRAFSKVNKVLRMALDPEIIGSDYQDITDSLDEYILIVQASMQPAMHYRDLVRIKQDILDALEEIESMAVTNDGI